MTREPTVISYLLPRYHITPSNSYLTPLPGPSHPLTLLIHHSVTLLPHGAMSLDTETTSGGSSWNCRARRARPRWPTTTSTTSTPPLSSTATKSLTRPHGHSWLHQQQLVRADDFETSLVLLRVVVVVWSRRKRRTGRRRMDGMKRSWTRRLIGGTPATPPRQEKKVNHIVNIITSVVSIFIDHFRHHMSSLPLTPLPPLHTVQALATDPQSMIPHSALLISSLGQSVVPPNLHSNPYPNNF